jgi:hypothetical protein
MIIAPTKATPSLISSLARFVIGDIRGGEYAITFRKETIRAALEQMFKGNYSPITEAATLTDGKAKKARAYHAGFATLGVIGADTKKIAYVGALTLPENKPARDAIDSATQHACATFFAAFDIVMSEKAAPKAKKEAAPAPAPDASATPNTVADDEPSLDTVAMGAAAVATVLAMIRNGVLSADQLEAIDEALSAVAVPASLADDLSDDVQTILAGAPVASFADLSASLQH